jgi:hypothetical protein
MTWVNQTNQYFVTMGEGDLDEISKRKDLNVEKSN